MHKVSQKKNASSLSVLKTLKLLLEGDYTMAELIQKLNEQEKESIFNNSVVSKYINTCRQSGIKIQKVQNRYYITELPFGMKLTNEEVDLIQYLKDVVTEEMSTSSCKVFQHFIDKLNRYANKKITAVEKKMYPLTFKSFENAINNKKKVILLFKNRQELKGIPVNITSERGKIFFNVYYKNRIRMIDAERLAGIKTTDEPFVGYMQEQDVLFELRGKLARRYEIREEFEERRDSNDPDKVVICNKSRNSEMLLSRLMRYDSLCEILSPAVIRSEMKNMIDETLLNYGIE